MQTRIFHIAGGSIANKNTYKKPDSKMYFVKKYFQGTTVLGGKGRGRAASFTF